MKSKAIIVMLAYNAATTLGRTVKDIPTEFADEIIFDSQFLIQAVYFGFKIGDLPAPCRYMSGASSIDLRRSIAYGLRTIQTVFQFIL
jgi:hypothetical protein